MKSLPRAFVFAIIALVLRLLPSAGARPLSPEEIQRFQDDLGIVLSADQKAEIAQIVKPDAPWPAWRSNAVARIEQARMANLHLEVVDRNGMPVSDAVVRARLRRNAFVFGGVLDLYNWNGQGEGYRSLVKTLFNGLGAQNGLKPKITNKHGLLPGFFEWAQTNGLPVRGHLLIWPGSGSLPYRDPYRVQQALDALRNAQNETNNPPPATEIEQLKSNLVDVVDFQIRDWASKWSVYEWDVINEPLEKRDVQNALEDYGQMARWFKNAETNAVLPGCKLAINEYQIISAKWWKPPSNGWSFESRTARYRTEIDRVVAGGGRLDVIGFQSRFKYGHIDPALVSDRLAFYETAYPDKSLAGTEFEIKDYGAISNEFSRAQMTEELLTVYYSHPRVAGLNVWTFMRDVPNAMCRPDGTLKLNGLVWYYLHRIRYATDETRRTDPDGAALVRGFKGDYDLVVDFAGQTYSAACVLTNDCVATVVLSDLSIPAYRYDEWLSDHPGIGAQSNRLADADGDGACNLAEYAVGSAPDDATSRPGSPRLEPTPSGRMQCVFSRRTDARSRGLRYWLEISTNLFDAGAWTTNGIAESGSGTPESGFEPTTNLISDGSAQHVFFRLRAEYRERP